MKLPLLLCIIFIISCVDQQDESYLSVTPFNFIPGPYESVVVSFGKNQNDFHAFAIKKKDIKQGIEFVSKSKNNTSFSVFGDVEGEALVRSEQTDTFAKVKVLSIDKEAQRAIFLVEATLLNLDTGELEKLEEMEVTVRGDNFLLLM